MPRFAPTDTRAAYDLICFDSSGKERTDDPHGLMTDLLLRTLADDTNGVTDVFLMSHGWLSDLPSARAQYDAWLGAMAKCEADAAEARTRRPDFKPLFAGIHWPSKPWGNESFGNGSFSVDGAPGENPVEALIDDYAARIADTPVARDALRRIVTGAMENVEPDELPPDVVAAYKTLNIEADMGIGGVGAGPGGDRSGFDPEGVYQSLREDTPSFGLFDLGGVLGVLRTLSFWRMKDRARWFGEAAGANLLARIMQASRRDLRIHLMGHSFGCIVLSAAVAGPKGRGNLARPVESLALVQGALSIWSYCDDIPATPGQPGYFYRVVSDKRVKGPIVSTRSVFDTANGKWYPLGAGVARQVAFAAPGELPKYGAVGAHGVRGPGIKLVDQDLLPADGTYQYAGGTVYNLECSGVVKANVDQGGAHNDYHHPEVAHAVWQAALAAG